MNKVTSKMRSNRLLVVRLSVLFCVLIVRLSVLFCVLVVRLSESFCVLIVRLFMAFGVQCFRRSANIMMPFSALITAASLFFTT